MPKFQQYMFGTHALVQDIIDNIATQAEPKLHADQKGTLGNCVTAKFQHMFGTQVLVQFDNVP